MDDLVPNDNRVIASRIQIARLWQSKTPDQIASDLGIAGSTYRGYEGKWLAESSLPRLAEALSVSESFLEDGGPDAIVPAASLTFRRKVRLKSPHVLHIQAVASFVPSVRRFMEHLVDLPNIRVPIARACGLTEIEDVAATLRQELGMYDAPLSKVLDFVEALGVSVFWVTSGQDFDAVSYWFDDVPYILINETHADGFRVRFSVMHELGHLVLHRSVPSLPGEDQGRLIEADANLFAGATLMPVRQFVQRFNPSWSLLDILDERTYWGASCAAIIRRARDLNLIPEERYTQLYMAISANGWRKREPASPPPEEGRVHRFFLDEAGEYGLSTEQLATAQRCPVGWLYEVMPLSRSYNSSPVNLFHRA